MYVAECMRVTRLPFVTRMELPALFALAAVHRRVPSLARDCPRLCKTTRWSRGHPLRLFLRA